MASAVASAVASSVAGAVAGAVTRAVANVMGKKEDVGDSYSKPIRHPNLKQPILHRFLKKSEASIPLAALGDMLMIFGIPFGFE